MSGKMYRFRPDERLDPRFLEMWLLSPEAQKRIDTMKTGISDSGLNLTHDRFVQLPVPVPPLDEQRRIVDLLEHHLSCLDAAGASLNLSLRRLAAMRRSILASMHRGEPRPLGGLAFSAGYGTSEKCVVDGPGPAVVRIPNLVGGRIDLSDEKRVADPSINVSKYMLRTDDLLIVRTNGSVDLIGRSAVVPAGVEAAFASYLIRFRLNEDLVRPKWVQAMLSTPQLRATIEQLAASSAGQHNLSLGKLQPLPIPLPPLAIQDQLLRRLAEIDGHAGRLDQALRQARMRQTNLHRFVLAAAFSGRLTGVGTDLSVSGARIEA